MDFELSDEQRLIQDTVRSFVDERVLPNAIENDIEHRLDLSVIAGMAELGLLGIVIPEEYGGAGLDFVVEALACFGLTEPGAGSDVASMRTTATREGDVYVLNGQKNWISYASVADHELVFAKTDPAAKHKGISAFIVERGWRGVTTRDTENKLGVWAGSTGELFFENVEVPAENLVGEEGQGFEIAMYGLDH